jgi:hypothetical protein
METEDESRPELHLVWHSLGRLTRPQLLRAAHSGLHGDAARKFPNSRYNERIAAEAVGGPRRRCSAAILGRPASGWSLLTSAAIAVRHLCLRVVGSLRVRDVRRLTPVVSVTVVRI